jgi:hypothetical protein
MSEFDFKNMLSKIGRQTVNDQVQKRTEESEEEEVPLQKPPISFVHRPVETGTAAPSSQKGMEELAQRVAKVGNRIVVAGAEGAQAAGGYAEGVASRFDPNRKIGPNEQYDIDKQTLPPGMFALKYGREAELDRYFQPPENTTSASERVMARQDNRTFIDKSKDFAVDAGSAAALERQP